MNRHYTLSDYYSAAGVCDVPHAGEVAMRFPPFAHQIDDLTFLSQHTRAGIWSEPGVGKTLPVQAYCLWLAGQGNKVICTMPPVLVQQFHKSLNATYRDVSRFYSSETLEGGPKQREKLFATWETDGYPDVLIMSYRMFVQYHKQLKLSGYTCVVVDEATAVKSPSSQLHEAVKIFAGNHRKDSNGVVLMTGSPVDTNVVDAYGLVAIITPDRYGSKKMFDRIHTITMPGKNWSQVIGYRNYEYLNSSLFLHGRRVKKSDVSDLPPRLITEMPIRLGRQHRELYQRIVDERIAEIGDRVLDLTEATALYQGMQRMILCPELFTDQEFENEVLLTLDTLLETLEGKKIVIYCWFQDSVEKLKARYAKHNPATLYGKTVGSKRDSEKMKFIEDPTCKVIIANPRSGGVGVDGFQAVSSHVVFAEVCPFVGVFQQSIDRLHRTGQKAESVNVYVLVPTGTISVKLRNDLLRKDMQQELVVQDKRTILNTLMGEEGLRGSLDELSYDIEAKDDLQSSAVG